MTKRLTPSPSLARTQNVVPLAIMRAMFAPVNLTLYP
jgi:hypothetical protein